MMHDPNCLFCKIIAGQIPSKKVYEDEHIFAFHDIAPWAPVHFLMVPKLHIASMAQLAPEHAALMGHLMTLAPRLALEQGGTPFARARDGRAPALAQGLRCSNPPCVRAFLGQAASHLESQ